jgi:hypothetical protein
MSDRSTAMSAETTPSGDTETGSNREVALRTGAAAGATVGYGCLAAFLYLVTVQVYRWFRDGEWTHFGMSEALHMGLSRCCVKDGDTGRLAALLQWLDGPTTWFGMHKVLELVPASLALFVLSILGNSVFIYCRDRLADRGSRLVP